MAETTRPVNVVDEKDIVIQEFFGRVASGDKRLSACVVTVHKASEEAWQTPEFDEYVLVLEGKVHLKHSDGRVVAVEANSGAFLPKNSRIKWVWPGPCKYIPICLPAFSTDNCGREDEPGNHHAKSSEAMQKLRELHAAKQHPWLFHVAKKSLWETAKERGEIYYPPTFEQDGKFTHATADPSKLIDVLNHFYKNVKEDFVCLRTSKSALEGAGIKVTFEATAPVGDIEAIDMGDQLFPHIIGGIPTKEVVQEEMPVLRAPDGTFLKIEGIIKRSKVNPSILDWLPKGFHQHAMMSLVGVVSFALGLGVGFLGTRRQKKNL
eukprot:CAMPEP_0114500224 /NCGR_PEP_ID=MMETSP0109-20121206/7846_1 /TAXON_ID=29199 /ORGANISM="Chlorarachnion reptans, Strain CCCM449" /LENGTH=320 /DNA_ID=CAMNT_0001677863 /DNA_START=65 /DNA_END=1027 /DNA_ORIENTATION=+